MLVGFPDERAASNPACNHASLLACQQPGRPAFRQAGQSVGWLTGVVSRGNFPFALRRASDCTSFSELAWHGSCVEWGDASAGVAMLRFTPIENAGQAEHYYSKSDGGYYLDDHELHREWGGQGAALLGL